MILIFNMKPIACLSLIILVAGGGLLRAQESSEVPVAEARRIASIIAIGIDEYSAGMDGTNVVASQEVEEARLFFSQALEAVDALDSGSLAKARPLVEELASLVERHEPAAELKALEARLVALLEQAAGAPLVPMPTLAPSLEKGRMLFAASCSSCHGESGRGDGPHAVGLTPAPADLTDPALRATTPLEFFQKIGVGVAGTAMPAFQDQMSVEERWSVALYAASLRNSDEERALGRRVFDEHCATCAFRFSTLETTAELNDDSLRSLVTARRDFHGLDDESAAAAAAYARVAAASEILGNDPVARVSVAAERSRRLARDAAALAIRGDRGRARNVTVDAYLSYERVETMVRARNGGQARRTEQAYQVLRNAVQGSGPEAISSALAEVEAALTGSVQSKRNRGSVSVAFGQSLVIILREGLEAILIIGALAAFLSKAGAGERKREMGIGVLLAVAASLATAALFATALKSFLASREVVEGVTMLVAAGVLFWVSYWLVSKIEVKKWQGFISGKMKRALGSGSRYALGAVAFLAVYREGFETVLFYVALFVSSEKTLGAAAAITAGIVLGLAILSLVYVLINRYSVRLPLKPFFGGTSALLYVMAFSFAGQGVAELQEAGYIPATPLEWFPSLPALPVLPIRWT